jgi:hypothetical protein
MSDQPPASDAGGEFVRQVQTLVDKGYPGLAGLTDEEFRGLLAPLEKRLPDLPRATAETSFQFVIVLRDSLVDTVSAMARVVDGRGTQGLTNMDPVTPSAFSPIDGLDLPSAPAYLLADVDTGAATLNVRPKDALPTIVDAGRTPLTIDEGVAVLTQFPDILQTHNAFQLLGSRAADNRIPSIWVSYGRPRLGWCWAGNPHTWLGSASAATRLGA